MHLVAVMCPYPYEPRWTISIYVVDHFLTGFERSYLLWLCEIVCCLPAFLRSFRIVVASKERTNVPNVYAIGDVNNVRYQLTPIAIESGKNLARRLYCADDSLVRQSVCLLINMLTEFDLSDNGFEPLIKATKPRLVREKLVISNHTVLLLYFVSWIYCTWADLLSVRGRQGAS